jgi:prepilin-type N-terminal cleavage/methylation domain-containing protein
MSVMNTKSALRSRGFTLIEILVVVAIIAVLTTLLYTYLTEARKESRDGARGATIEQLKLAMKLIKEDSELPTYPSYPAGVELGWGGGLDSEILRIYPQFTPDSQSTGAGGAYGYWYDSSFRCSAAAQVVLVAHLESANNSNYSSVCTASSPDAPPNSWPASEVYIQIVQ